MDVISFLSLAGGLALFLYGMNIMGQGLERLAGGKLERTLERMTGNIFKGVLLGTIVTAVIQSSSATTVMVVGFVNSGIMQLSQAVGVIMGANVGTTITAWVLSLTGIEGDSLAVQLLKPGNFSAVFAVAGIVLLMFSKRGKRKDIGSIFLGFAVLMFGMTAMSGAVSPLADDPAFHEILLTFNNPLFGVLAGFLLTAVIQSSSASVGILQALTVTKGITYNIAIPIIMGQNIGTCVTALLSCIGANKNAKRAAMIHLFFNVIGTIIFLALYFICRAVFDFSFADQIMNPASVALVHSIFNIFSTLCLIPFNKLLVKLVKIVVKDGGRQTGEMTTLDARFLNTPSVAVEQARRACMEMADLAYKTFAAATSLLGSYDQKKSDEITEKEDLLDKYEDMIGTYLVKLSSRDVSEEDSKTISVLLHTIGDLERIGDHAINILDSAKEMHEKGLRFSEGAEAEQATIRSALLEILELTIIALSEGDVEKAKKVEPLEQVIDLLADEIKLHHVARLKSGVCTIEMGFVLADLLGNYERVSDHCSNIAVAQIEIAASSFQTHSYLNSIKNSDDPAFKQLYTHYLEKYALDNQIMLGDV